MGWMRLASPGAVIAVTVFVVACQGGGGGSMDSSSKPDESKTIASPDFAYEVIEVPSPGTVRGTVRLKGEPPILEETVVSKDQDICGPRVPRSALRMGPGATIEGAVVSLVGAARGKELAPLGRPAEIEIVKCMAIPRVQIVPVGTTLELINSDPLLHDVYAYDRSNEEVFHVVLPIRDFRARVEMARAGVIHLRCGAGHPWMSSIVFVQEHPYYTLTAARGTYTLSGVPAGSYRVRVWHEILNGEEVDLTIAAGETAVVNFELTSETAGEEGR